MNLPHFILNPTASAGQTGRSQAQLLRIVEEFFPNGFTLDVTTRAGQATEMTAKALAEGSNLIVAVGGDGTMNEVINGFFAGANPRGQKSRLGVLGIGTAGDVSRNLNLPASLRDQVSILAGKHSRAIDLGKVTFGSGAGKPVVRYFLNECQPGIAAAVVRRVTPGLKRLGGFLAFGLMSTYTAMTYRARRMVVRVDRQKPVEGRMLGVVVANGRYAGGGMDFAPASRIDDGSLDIIVIWDQHVPSRLFNFPKIYSGGHVDLPWVTVLKGKSVRVESAERVALEADGELLGFLPCDVRVVPSALRVCSGPKG